MPLVSVLPDQSLSEYSEFCGLLVVGIIMVSRVKVTLKFGI